jgi:uncharacterized protein YdaU (DUF1376 family)
MAALPYMPLYVADYLADAAHLTTLQHGAYLLLIMNYWQRGAPLPNDDAKLARIAGMELRSWKRIRAELQPFFACVDGAWMHSRIDAELAKVEAKSLKCKKAGRASVQRRLNGRSTDAEQTFNHTDTDTSNTLAKANAVDVEKVMFEQGISFLGGAGVRPDRARTMLGKWKRDHGPGAVIEALGAAQRHGAIDPIPFIEGRFNAKAKTYDPDRITV